MDATDWTARYRELFARGVARYRPGGGPEDVLAGDETAFLRSIGGTAREFFDQVEDCARDGEPDAATALRLTAARRDYFLKEDGGQWRAPLASSSLPPKKAELESIPWLPRIIEKARRKLQGTMDDDLMYGCGGDRAFSRRHHVHLADFLQIVREHWDDESAILGALLCKTAGERPAAD